MIKVCIAGIFLLLMMQVGITQESKIEITLSQQYDEQKALRIKTEETSYEELFEFLKGWHQTGSFSKDFQQFDECIKTIKNRGDDGGGSDSLSSDDLKKIQMKLGESLFRIILYKEAVVEQLRKQEAVLKARIQEGKEKGS